MKFIDKTEMTKYALSQTTWYFVMNHFLNFQFIKKRIKYKQKKSIPFFNKNKNKLYKEKSVKK